MKNQLRFIRKVEMIDAKYITSYQKVSNKYTKVSFAGDFTELCLVGLASLELSDKIENRVRFVTCKLSATVMDDIEVINHRYVFRCTSTDGTVYLIGNSEQPYPIVLLTDAMQGKESENSKKTLTVSLTSYDSICEILS